MRRQSSSIKLILKRNTQIKESIISLKDKEELKEAVAVMNQQRVKSQQALRYNSMVRFVIKVLILIGVIEISAGLILGVHSEKVLSEHCV